MPSDEFALTASESEWVFDFLMNLFRSPTWEVPIMTFIDENCIIFDNEDENKFSYTETHEQFRTLVSTLLIENLSEIGLGPEEFASICERFRNNNEVSIEVVNQILAIDDFLTFKKLMVKRNMELELEAVQELRDEGEASHFSTEAKEDMDYQFKKALHEASKEKGSIYDGSDEDVDEEYNAELDAQIRASMDSQLFEMELLCKQEEMEQAELEEAIAMSIAMEEERLRLAQLDSKKTNVEDSQEITSDIAPSKSNDKTSLTRKPSLEKSIPGSLDELAEEVAEKKKKAHQAFRENQQAIREQRDRRAELIQKANVTDDEMEKRAEYLRKQRDRLIARKKKQREKKLKEYEQEMKESPQPEPPAPLVQKLAETPKVEDAKDTEADERRKALRVALARRMKQDLLETQEERVTKKQVQQYIDLDEKLKQVEVLRYENQKKQDDAYRDLIQQQSRRARNLKNCIKKGVLTEDDFEFAEG